MADLPVANVSIDPEGGAFGVGTDYLIVLGAVATSADASPRVFASTKALLAQHGYSPAADYCAAHFEESGKPVIFCGLPIVSTGYIGQQDQSNVDGTSGITVSGTPLDDVDLELTVVTGGTVGTPGIVFNLSLDGGDTVKRVRLGSASSYTVPYVGLVISFGAGTLIADDAYTCVARMGRWDQAGLQAAREALASQLKPARSFLVVGDLAEEDDASDVLTEVNAYETANDRFTYARAQVRDSYVAANMSQTRKRMTGSPSLTFAEVGASGDTITRATGSWITDGFAVGDTVTVTGSGSNNVSGVIATLSATVITFGSSPDLEAEVTSAATVYATPTLTFAEVGLTGDTITRSSGSWISDGFKVGDEISILGSASNNLVDAVIADLSATVLTLDDGDLLAEVIGSYGVTVTADAETMGNWVSSVDAEFSDIDDEPRIDLAAGRARKLSPISGWRFRRPIAWAATTREYQHDVQIPCWRKADGSLSGWDLEDDDGVVVEYDDRTQGGLLAAQFTCARTWANGPRGTFIALALTRANADSLLSRTHNMAVANVMCTVIQGQSELAIGQVLELNDDGTGTEASLVEIEEKVNTALAIELLQRKSEGPRASSATWTASRTDVLNVPGAILTGVGDLLLNGTIERVDTRVRVQQAG
jgi:hypothetical protein